MAEFKIGQDALEVCKVILKNHPEISRITLIAHQTCINWRQTYKTIEVKSKHLLEGFEHQKPITQKEYTRQEIKRLTLKELPELKENQVWSVSSKVRTRRGKTKHIPMMNFHTENKSTDIIKKALKYICGNKKGALLSSGRYHHYYGNFLLENDDWKKFMAEFLMPTILVSPRYIGHRLYEGYCTLRLTKDNTYKPTIPKVIKII